MRNNFGKEICIQGRGISSKQNIKGHFKIPSLVLNFAESLTAKSLLKRTEEGKGKTGKKNIEIGSIKKNPLSIRGILPAQQKNCTFPYCGSLHNFFFFIAHWSVKWHFVKGGEEVFGLALSLICHSFRGFWVTHSFNNCSSSDCCEKRILSKAWTLYGAGKQTKNLCILLLSSLNKSKELGWLFVLSVRLWWLTSSGCTQTSREDFASKKGFLLGMPSAKLMIQDRVWKKEMYVWSEPLMVCKREWLLRRVFIALRFLLLG